MGNMNFQDEEDAKSQQQPSPARQVDEPKVKDIFADQSGINSKFILVAIVVLVIAGLVGGLYYLNKHGYLKFMQKHPTVVVINQPAPVPPPTTKPAPPVNVQVKPAGKFALQVSAFRTKLLADNYAAKLKGKGIDAYVFPGDAANDGRWFKVCVGSFENKIQAIAAIEGMKKKVGTDVWVVPAQ